MAEVLSLQVQSMEVENFPVLECLHIAVLKAGQMAFGKMAALELAGYKIRVNVFAQVPSKPISVKILIPTNKS